MGILQALFCNHGPQYLERFGPAMPGAHKKVIAAIMRCRSEANGATVYQCQACGELHVVQRCCGNRHCPGCQQHKTRQWLDWQLKRQLPGHHFMLTFTVPEALRTFFRGHQRPGYGALFEASSGAIKALVPDPKYIGADTPGFFGVLHTWGGQLQYHPHIHYLVPGGALDSQDRQWHASSPGFYLPVHALSAIYRAKFRDQMEQQGLLGEIPPELWAIDWNVNCQAVGSGQASVAYLSRYVFKVAISERRIVRVDDTNVVFQYRAIGESIRPRSRHGLPVRRKPVVERRAEPRNASYVNFAPLRTAPQGSDRSGFMSISLRCAPPRRGAIGAGWW